MLQALGVNATAIFASVGILTLVIGLGCQSLIADIVAGMFIIFENEYNVGEIVTIDDFRGTVIEIGIRATKLLDYAGNIKIINNSDISNVVNMSRELSLAVVDCLFPYDVPVQHIEKILKDNFEAFRVKIPGIVEGPFYKGVSDFGASNIAVTIIAKCLEEDRYQVQRDLKSAFCIANSVIVKQDINQKTKSASYRKQLVYDVQFDKDNIMEHLQDFVYSNNAEMNRLKNMRLEEYTIGIDEFFNKN